MKDSFDAAVAAADAGGSGGGRDDAAPPRRRLAPRRVDFADFANAALPVTAVDAPMVIRASAGGTRAGGDVGGDPSFSFV